MATAATTTEATFAYHVTKEQIHSENNDEVDKLAKQLKEMEITTKKWTELKMTKTALNPPYDSPMGSLIEMGVAMSTTLWKNGLPTISPYPKGEGAKHGDYYSRVKVPLERFKDYRIIKCKSTPTKRVEQVSILLVPVDPSDPFKTALNERVDEKIAQKEVTELTHESNEYLYRDQTTKKWRTNNYDGKSNNVWVNIVIPHNVTLEADCEWDTVMHKEPSTEHY